MLDSRSVFFLTIPLGMEGYRLDKALSELLTDYSRVTIQQWLKDGNILLDKQRCKQKYKLRGGEQLRIVIPNPPPLDWVAQKIDLDIVFEDSEILVINKPAGLVVHPGAGNTSGTLLNGLLFRKPDLRYLPRAGIVHRIDKDTSGLLVVARTEHARQWLIHQLQDRSMHRHYIAVVNGLMISGETINQPIGRHRQDRLKMAVVSKGKSAVTHVRVKQKFRSHSVLNVQLSTGRTHQIRVHLSWRGYSIVGDTIYGGRLRVPQNTTRELNAYLKQFRRHALHAEHLVLNHPGNQKRMEWTQPVSEDIRMLIQHLKNDYEAHT